MPTGAVLFGTSIQKQKSRKKCKIEMCQKGPSLLAQKEKQMKKVVTILMISIIVFMLEAVYAADTFEIEFKTLNNKKDEKFDLYILLPEDYIKFAIQEADLKLDYEGASTLKKNQIPGIVVKKENVQEETYTEKGIEYVQIRLEKENETYLFDLLENYPKMDIKYRIKNIQKDYIVHIDNFKIENGKCEMEYDYTKDIVKQPDKKVMPSGIIILIILLIVILIVAGIARIKGRK